LARSDKIKYLQGIPLFSGLEPDELQTLFDHAAIRKYAKNTVIIQDGDESDSLYVIASGKVKVYLTDEKGKEVILNFQETGEYFGELALLDRIKRSASVITLVPCQFIVITRQDFMRCLAQHPTIALRMMKDLTTRLRELTEEVKSLALMDVYGRVARTLLKLAEEKDGQLQISQALSRKDLANMVGSSREMVSRILKELEREGYLLFQGKAIIIQDRLPRTSPHS
jgi:CRP/FNR family cyclic AMP-dependent transcriptional regulator